jgi:hypothetical protein
MISALVALGNKNYLVGVCYNSQGSVDELAKAFTFLQNNYHSDPPIILAGDFNLNLLNDTSTNTQEFRGLMASLGLCPVIDMVTRPASNSCLDNILISHPHIFADILPGLLDILPADHYPAFLGATLIPDNIENNITASAQQYTRLFTTQNHEKFAFNLMQIDWNAFYLSQDINDKTEIFMEKLNSAYNESFPVVVKKKSAKI